MSRPPRRASSGLVPSSRRKRATSADRNAQNRPRRPEPRPERCAAATSQSLAHTRQRAPTGALQRSYRLRRGEPSDGGVMVEAGEFEPKSLCCSDLPSCGHAVSPCGQNLSNSGQVSWLATSADGILRTGPGHGAASCGHPLALKWPQSVDPDLARVIEVWPRLPASKREQILCLANSWTR